MVYELTIEDNKEKSVIAFLKHLDFVQIKKVEKRTASTTDKLKTKSKGIGYFGACLDWDIDASELRSKSSRKNNQEW